VGEETTVDWVGGVGGDSLSSAKRVVPSGA